MSDPDEGPPSPDLPDELVEAVGDLDDHQIAELVRYCEALLADRADPVAEAVRETVDESRIVSVREEDGYVTVVRRDEGRPTLYRVRREHHPDGSTDLQWTFLGRVTDE